MPDQNPNILILTPIKNGSQHLPGYLKLLERLDWPRDNLSLGILESDSNDQTWDILQSQRAGFAARMAHVTLVKRDYGFSIPPGVPRWAGAFQLARLTILARSRNQLLFRALRNEDWVLWLDVDVIDYPADIIQKLLAPGVNIIHPHCVKQYGGPTFDLNAWSDHGRNLMQDLRGQGLVRLDAVGGTMLMVRADLHRDGLVFPTYRYGLENSRIRPKHPVWERGEIETEGLGMMAADMGYQCWGLPDLEILHADS
jgi:peptide chain release factor subunit 1